MKIIHILMIASALLVNATATAAQVGQVKYARGAVTLQHEDGSGARLIGEGDNLAQGDVIKTGPKSFAIVTLADDTKMTLRPGTSFAVENMTAEKSDKATALLRLFRGGLRAVTGYISKVNPNGYQVRTAVATMGIRGTEFDARLCEADCAEENEQIEKKQQKQVDRSIARIVFKRGDITATDYLDRLRTLELNGAIYEGDTIITGAEAYTVLVFRDKSRITLEESTKFRIDELRFEESDKAKAGASALFSLLRGGLRTVTGLIGKTNPDKYRMRTAVATMGIRGTGYDVLCTGTCADDGTKSNIKLPNGDGLYAHVWDGEITLDEQVVKLNEAAFMSTTAVPPTILPTIPSFFLNNPLPRPNDIKVDESTLFSKLETQKTPPGLYVSVTDGKVDVKSLATEKTIQVGKGQAVYAGGQELQQLPDIPAFQKFDSVPTPDDFSGKGIGLGVGDVDAEDKDLVCEVK